VAIKTSNVKQWSKAMGAWMKASRGKSHADCINHFGKWSLINAMKKTPKAKLGKFPFNQTANPEKGGKTYKQKFYYAMAASAGVAPENIKSVAIKMYRAKRRSSGAIKAGFIKPLQMLGGIPKSRAFAGGSASKSRGRRAKDKSLKAMSFNNVEASGSVAYFPMMAAMKETAVRQHTWAINRLQKANNKFSSKRY